MLTYFISSSWADRVRIRSKSAKSKHSSFKLASNYINYWFHDLRASAEDISWSLQYCRWVGTFSRKKNIRPWSCKFLQEMFRRWMTRARDICELISECFVVGICLVSSPSTAWITALKAASMAASLAAISMSSISLSNSYSGSSSSTWGSGAFITRSFTENCGSFKDCHNWRELFELDD